MFGMKEEKKAIEDVSAASTVIGKTTIIKGDILAQGNVRIEGVVEGNINSPFRVATGVGSQIRGNLTAQQADLEGSIEGNLVIEDLLTLKPTALVNGDITTSKLIVQQGAVFVGKSLIEPKTT